MTSGMSARIEKQQRLILLRELEKSPGYTGNDALLQSACSDFGLPISRSILRRMLDWLARHEPPLIQTRTEGSTVIATLLEDGQAVATGLSVVDGIARPAPNLIQVAADLSKKLV